jgi:hypothetical protein
VLGTALGLGGNLFHVRDAKVTKQAMYFDSESDWIHEPASLTQPGATAFLGRAELTPHLSRLLLLARREEAQETRAHG